MASKFEALMSVARSVARQPYHHMPDRDMCRCSQCDLIREARAAIDLPDDEPVAVYEGMLPNAYHTVFIMTDLRVGTKLYTAPQPPAHDEARERAEFEVFLGQMADSLGGQYVDHMFDRHADGGYRLPAVNSAWTGWKAGRAAMREGK